MTEDQASLGALLHDVGFAALLLSVLRKKEANPPPLRALRPDIDALHEPASKTVTKLRGLPTELSLIVANHHHEHTGNSVRVTAMVNAADYLTQRFDAHILGPPDEEGMPMSACSNPLSMVDDRSLLLGLRDDSFDRICSEAEPILGEVMRD